MDRYTFIIKFRALKYFKMFIMHWVLIFIMHWVLIFIMHWVLIMVLAKRARKLFMKN